MADPAPTTNPVDPSGDFLDLRRLFHILLQRRILMSRVVGFCFGLGVLYLLLAVRIYEAVSTVEMHTRRPRIVGQEGAYVADEPATAAAAADALNTHFLKMQSESVRNEVVQALRRQADVVQELARYSDEELGHMLHNEVELTRVLGTYLVRIAARAPSSAFAAAIANAYAQVAVEAVKNSTKQASIDAVQWLQEQISTYEQELMNSEAKLIAFRQKNNIDGLIASKSASDQALTAINQDLVTYETRVTTLREMVSALEQVESRPESIGILPSTIPRADLIQARLKAYIDAQGELKKLALRYTDRHPLVTQQISVVEVLRDELREEIKRARETTKSDLQLVTAYVQSIQSNKMQQIQSGETILNQINRFNTDVIPLERALEASDSSYKGLLARIEQARLSIDEDTSLLTIYEMASPPPRPVSPRPLLVLAIALILGCGASVGLALMVHLLQDTLSAPFEIESDFRQNLLGLIPRVDDALAPRDLARLSHSDTFSPFNEAVAALRGALLMQGHRPADRGWAIMITSVMPEEGKTTISCNLAIALAKTCGRVLLIDGDMRRPRLHDVFDIPRPRQLLMEILHRTSATDADFATVPQPTDIDRLHVTLGHPMPGVSPTELLENGQAERFLRWATRHYDLVLVDTPPLGAASDALVYGRMADDVLLICRANRSRKAIIRQALRDLEKNRCPLIGMVMNDFRPDALGQSLGYGSYYGYRYGGYYTPGGDRDHQPAATQE